MVTVPVTKLGIDVSAASSIILCRVYSIGFNVTPAGGFRLATLASGSNIRVRLTLVLPELHSGGRTFIIDKIAR